MSPGLRPTSVSSGILVHSAVWPQYTWAEKWGAAVPFSGGSWAQSNTMWPGPVGRKVEGRAVVPLSVGTWVPIERNVTWVEAYVRIKWYPGASSRLATMHMGRKVGGRCFAPFRGS